MPTRLLAPLLAAALLVLLAAPGAASNPGHADPRPRHEPWYEIWALDQGEGQDRIHVYDPALNERAVIDFDGWNVTTPHMIRFDSEHRYAVVASTTSASVAIIRTADYEVVDVIDFPAGAGTHMAAVTPDDDAIWVSSIGGRTFTEIVPDWEAEEFTLGRELDVRDDPLWQAEFSDVGDESYEPAPVCHEYTADGAFAYVTLGPAAGGLVVIDITGEPVVVEAFPRAEVAANCGLALSHDGAKMYANWGDPGPADGSAAETGAWYVFDTSEHTLVGTHATLGVDAHGVRITPDGSELWQVNRGTSNGIVVDTATDEVVDEIAFTGDTPDILDFSPDGTRAFVSLRGPNPRSGAPHVATGTTPGFAVLDVASREKIALVEPAAGTDGHEHSDFHGIGVRVVDEVQRLAGADRIGTALAVSQATWADGAATGAVVARADDFPDALAGVALAAAVGGPVLLTPAGGLPPAVGAELERVLAPGDTVHLLGGERALTAQVAADVAAHGFTGERLAGADRYATAEAIVEAIGDPALLLVTTGHDFADAVAAGAAAAAHGGAVVLTRPDEPHPAADRVLAAHDVARYAVGGPAARAYPDAEDLVGADRYATAAAVAEGLFETPHAAALARGDAFPDALTGGVHAASVGAPVLLTTPTALHTAAAGHLCTTAAAQVFAYGGTAALDPAVLHTAAGIVTGGTGC